MAKTQKTIIHQVNGKYQSVYILNAKLFWAKLRKPEPASEYNEHPKWTVTVFVTEEQKDQLEELGVNKQFAEVDKTKIKKGKNKGNIKYSSDNYAGTEGMFGFNLDLSTVKKDGSPAAPPLLVAADGKTKITTDIGNGSVAHLRCNAYNPKVDPDMLCLNINLVKVIDLVEYEQGGVSDDILGVVLEADENEDDTDIPFEVDEEEEQDEDDY